MGVALILSLFVGVIGINNPAHGGVPQQQGALDDAPGDDPDGARTDGMSAPNEPKQTVKRYDQAPAITIDPSRIYRATIKTSRGDIEVDLYPESAPQAVNSFVFLAREGYYDDNPVMVFKAKTREGAEAPYITAAGDPTGTGSVRPGFTTPAEPNSRPFVRGAVGMGDSQTAANDGRFWISLLEQPTWNGKYTNLGQVLSGLEVLTLLAQGDAKILSVTVSSEG